MSRERAALARKEMEYWLAEADEWKRLKETPEELAGGNSTQLDWCAEFDNPREIDALNKPR
jgi:hypothetical protein